MRFLPLLIADADFLRERDSGTARIVGTKGCANGKMKLRPVKGYASANVCAAGALPSFLMEASFAAR